MIRHIKKHINWHWIFWISYFLISHIVFSNPYAFTLTSLTISTIFIIHNMGLTYLTLYWWIPYFFRKKQYILFIIITLLSSFVFAISLGYCLIYFNNICCIEVVDFEDAAAKIPNFNNAIFWSNFTALTIFLIPHFILQRMEVERRNRQLEKEKLEAELKLLKSQLHPHFLFNALNNIYFLIKKDPDTAAQALAGFSNLLRFQLYEANNAFIPLEKEIEYLQQFAEIAQLRKGEDFEVLWQISENIEGVIIAPLLLLPLIENAFKHSQHKNTKILVHLTVNQEQLHFQIKNEKETTNGLALNGLEDGGIGLKNVQKRLELIYPKKHTFKIQETNKAFVVDLYLT
jgi:sensor histidine kinase YesM